MDDEGEIVEEVKKLRTKNQHLEAQLEGQKRQQIAMMDKIRHLQSIIDGNAGAGRGGGGGGGSNGVNVGGGHYADTGNYVDAGQSSAGPALPLPFSGSQPYQ